MDTKEQGMTVLPAGAQGALRNAPTYPMTPEQLAVALACRECALERRPVSKLYPVAFWSGL